jgi:hypothetical protein
MKGGLLLNVVIGQGPAILQLLAGKDQPLLIRRNSFLILEIFLQIKTKTLKFLCAIV